MQRTTASLLTGALAVGTFAVLATVTPGIASADDCGTTTVTDTNQATSGWLLPDTENSSALNTGRKVSFVQNANSEGLYMEPGTGKVTVTYPIDGGRPLASQTDQDEYAYEYLRDSGGPREAGAPSYQLIVDLNGGTLADGGYNTLVYEPVYDTGATAGTWWASNPKQGALLPGANIQHGGGHGSVNWGTLDQFSLDYPNAQILSFGVQQYGTPGSPSVLTSVTFGCNVFEFELANRGPQASILESDTGDKDYRTYSFDGSGSSDPDGDTLTYNWAITAAPGNTAPSPGTGATFTVTFPNGPGTYNVILTVSDGKGGTHSTNKQITVTPPSNTNGAGKLPNTGASVIGLGVLAAVGATGGIAGTVYSKRRRNSSSAA